jgi:hypothetical protein
MTRFATALGTAIFLLALTACGDVTGGGCSSGEDVAAKVTSLTEDLKKAQDAGKLDAAQAGDIGARIMSAGTKFGAEKNHRAYCQALDDIRKSAGL